MVKTTLSELNRLDLTKENEEDERNFVVHGDTYDPDCPPMTTEEIEHMKEVNKRLRAKQSVSLRLSGKTIEEAKSYGEGYTSFLSRLLDLAIEDKELVKKAL